MTRLYTLAVLDLSIIYTILCPFSLSEVDTERPVRFVSDGHGETQWWPPVLQPVSLQDLDHQNVRLQLSKSSPDAAPGSVAEGDVSERVGLVVFLVSSDPSLR